MNKTYIKIGILVLLISLSIFNYLYLPQFKQTGTAPLLSKPNQTIQAENIPDGLRQAGVPEEQVEEVESASIVVNLLSQLEKK